MIINASIEARMTSSRLPGKVLKTINSVPSLQVMVGRVSKSLLINDIIVATTTNKEDDPIVELCENIGVKYFRGSENNVYQRVLDSHILNSSDIIVELSGDCPLIDYMVIDKGINTFLNSNYDYVSTSWNYPLGMATEIFTLDTLKSVSKNRTLTYEDKEHVSPYLYTSGNYRCFQFEPELYEICEGLSLTLDTKEDFELIKTICNRFDDFNFSLKEIVKLVNQYPELKLLNRNIHRKGLA